MLNPMSEDLITGLLAKRAELASRVQALQSSIFHLDETLALMGHLRLQAPRVVQRRFANGELIACVGEAERAGHKTAMAIAIHIMQAKGWDVNDATLRTRLLYSVKECRKRTSPRG